MVKNNKNNDYINCVYEDIRFTKTQIWNTTYLTILAIIGVVTGLHFIKQPENPLFGIYVYIFISLIILIGILGIAAVIFYNYTIERNRNTLERNRDILPKPDEYAVRKEPGFSRVFFAYLHPIVITIAIIVGVGVCVYLLF